MPASRIRTGSLETKPLLQRSPLPLIPPRNLASDTPGKVRRCDGETRGGGGTWRRHGHPVRCGPAQAVAHPERQDARRALRRGIRQCSRSTTLPASTRSCLSCRPPTTTRRSAWSAARSARSSPAAPPARTRSATPWPTSAPGTTRQRRASSSTTPPAPWSPSRSSPTACQRSTNTTRSAPPSRPRTRSWRSTNGVIAHVPPRETLYRAQTPQCFRLETIAKAHALAAADPAFTPTDDCGVVLRYLPGTPVHIVPGSETNLKITYPTDLAIAEALLRATKP